MGLGAIMQAAGSFVRAEGESNVLKNETRKRVVGESTLARSRGEELNAKAKERDDNTRKSIDAFWDSKSATMAEEAARLGLIAASISAAASITKAATAPKFDAGALVGSIVGGVFSVVGALIAYLGASDEAEMMKDKSQMLSKDARQDQADMNALNGNPEL